MTPGHIDGRRSAAAVGSSIGLAIQLVRVDPGTARTAYMLRIDEHGEPPDDQVK
jgi:hypothetical protein